MTFTSALNFIKGILSSAGVFAPLLTMFGVTIPPVALAVVPIITTLMNSAEESLGDGTGALKKSAVVSGAVAFTKTMQTVSTGGQKETWSKITPELVDTTIDTIATIANGISNLSDNEPIFDDSEWERTKADRGHI